MKSEPSSVNFVLIQQAYETLKDPELRKRYDEQYARQQTLNGVARVAAEVDLDDMEYQSGDGEDDALYRFSCRCGGAYEISEQQLGDNVDLVFCNGCTLQIRVLYELQDC